MGVGVEGIETRNEIFVISEHFRFWLKIIIMCIFVKRILSALLVGALVVPFNPYSPFKFLTFYRAELLHFCAK